ncbi:type VI secretion system Vgr family protein [Chondromyces apiculatus]|uniref:VgrG protein n=1 Tax=Chondromyces apiculatus DSM 436 TaxID=1192034 RepID=A0A017TA13_9BACT|nr:type VI secretion system tip protein TssI/VgrG [Chondromyces apiculatus]EYF06108.1 VgrG protein [Chondromyces apiculatus DSM 436]
MSASPDFFKIRIEMEGIEPDALEISQLTGRESISQPFEIELLLVCRDPAGLGIEVIVGEKATIVFERGDVELRRLHGMIANARDRLDTETSHATYRVTFTPRVHKLTLSETLDVFLDLNIPGILRKKLDAAGFTEGEDYLFRLYETYPVRDFVVQYKETDLAFISRLTEHLGISYFFEHESGRDVMVFTDRNSGFRAIEGDERVSFRPRGDPCDVFQIEETVRMVPGEFVVRDYNYRTPHVALNGVSTVPSGTGAVVEYGSHVKTPDEAQQLAEIRAQERLTWLRVFDGQSDLIAFRAGARLTLEGHPYGDLNLLLVEVTHRASLVTLGTGHADGLTYENAFRAIPYTRRYRPPRVTPKPRVHGVLTGVIDGPKGGDYAQLDDDGRYHVRFLFDTSTPEEQQASRPVRMAQPHAGAGYGMHFPLRQGVEVILTFVDGDPDRPIIVSTVPNPQTASPVTAGNAPRNIIRTGGGNEINIDDTGDNQRIKMSTPHKSTTFQLGYRNSPEDGAILETQGASSSIAMAGTAMYTSASASVSTLYKLSLSGQISTVAEYTPFATAVSTVKELMGQALDLAGSYLDLKAAQKAKKEAELKLQSVRDSQASYNAEQRRKAARKRTGDALKALESGCTMTPDQQAEVNALRQAYEDAQKAYDEKLIEKRTTLEWLADAKKGEWVPNVDTANAVVVTDSYAQIQTQEIALEGINEELPVLKTDYETARLAYLEKLKELTPDPPSATQQAALDEADDAITDEPAADDEANAAADTAFNSRNAYNTQVGVNELGEEAIKTKELRRDLEYAKTANVLFSEVMALFAGIKDFIERFKKEDNKVELLATKLASFPREDPTFALKSTYVPPLGTSILGVKHTLGSSGDMIIYADHELLSWAKTTLLLGKDGVLIESGKHLSLLSADKAELAAKDKLLQTSKQIDVRAYDKLELKAEPDPAVPSSLGSVGTLALESKGAMTLKSQDQSIELQAKSKPGQRIRMEAKTDLFGGAENVTMNASKVAQLLSGSVSMKLDAQAGTATLGTPTWKLSIKDGEAKLGTSQNGLTVQSAATLISYGPSMVKVASAKTQIKAQGMLELEGQTIRANGKILLG